MFRISGSIYLFILLTVLGISFVVWFYYRTIQAVSVTYKVIFILLRSVAFLLLLLVFFGTILQLHFIREKKADIVLLIDNSASMQISDKGKKRSLVLNEFLQSPFFQHLKNRYKIHPYTFAENTIQVRDDFLDSLLFQGRGTDLAQALITVTDQKYTNSPQALVIFSDGNYTIGDNPIRIAHQLQLPVYSVAVGDTTKKSDILITQVLTNDITYKDNITPFTVSLQGFGFGGREVTVSLLQEGKILEREKVAIPFNNLEATAEFEYKLARTGINKLTVEVDSLEKELTWENNRRKFFVKVLESRIKILLLASSPSPDLTFLKRMLETDKDVELTVRTQKISGGFYEGSSPDKADFDDCDLILMLDFPSSSTPQYIWQRLQSIIMDRQKPFMFFAGRNFDREKINTLKDFLPCTIDRKIQREAESPRVNQENITHPLLHINQTGNTSLWNALPPIFPACRISQVKPNDVILCETANDIYSGPTSVNKHPLILVHQAGGDKSIVFLGYGFYRWDLVMWGLGKSNEVLQGFMGNAVRWLSVKEESDRIIVKTSKYNYKAGEKVFLSVQVYDQAYKPLSGAKVQVKLETPHDSENIKLTDTGNGQYWAEKRFFQSGNYKIAAEARMGSQILGKDEEEFSVDSFNPEFVRTRADFGLLRKVSSVTGGKFLTDSNIDSLDQYLQFEPVKVELSREIEFFQSPWILALIILLLSADWFLRKRKGML